MAHAKKQYTIFQELKHSAEEFDRHNPVIGRRWYVVEITPAYDTGGYYSEYVPESRQRVSGYFYDISDAWDYYGEIEPDEGKTLDVQEERLRRYTVDRWGTV